MKRDSVTEIKYFNNIPSRLYESIDERLCILGGKKGFEMPAGANRIYAYDLPSSGTAIVLIPKDPRSEETSSRKTKNSGVIHILGIKTESFYNQVHRALKELHELSYDLNQ